MLRCFLVWAIGLYRLQRDAIVGIGLIAQAAVGNPKRRNPRQTAGSRALTNNTERKHTSKAQSSRQRHSNIYVVGLRWWTSVRCWSVPFGIPAVVCTAILSQHWRLFVTSRTGIIQGTAPHFQTSPTRSHSPCYKHYALTKQEIRVRPAEQCKSTCVVPNREAAEQQPWTGTLQSAAHNRAHCS